jgi:hypothetical protein
MLGEVGQWLLVFAPFLFTWTLLVFFTGTKRTARVCISALLGGVMWAAALYWDEAEAGNCCREDPHIHPQSTWAELWEQLPAVLMFGCVGACVLAVAELAKSKLQKK